MLASTKRPINHVLRRREVPGTCSTVRCNHWRLQATGALQGGCEGRRADDPRTHLKSKPHIDFTVIAQIALSTVDCGPESFISWKPKDTVRAYDVLGSTRRLLDHALAQLYLAFVKAVSPRGAIVDGGPHSVHVWRIEV
jgi:hypothetical protein